MSNGCCAAFSALLAIPQLSNKPPSKSQSQLYSIPCNGYLRLDFVSYMTPTPTDEPASDDNVRTLLRQLRVLRSAYCTNVLAVRREYLPGGKTRREEAALQAAREARGAKVLRARSAAAAYLGGGDAAGGEAEEELELTARGPPTWWEPSGLDPSALLLEHPLGTSSGGATAAGLLAMGATPADEQRQRSVGGAAASSRPASTLARTAALGAARRSTATASGAGQALMTAATGGTGTAAAATEQETAAAQEARRLRALLARLLRADSPRRLAAAFSTLSDTKAAAVIAALAAMQPGGLQAATLLIDALSPVVASRLVLDAHFDSLPALLPAELRAQLLALLSSKTRDNIRAAVAEVATAAAQRSADTLAALRVFGWGRCVSCAQLVAVLRALGPGVPEDRCSAIVTLWSKVVDRGNMVQVFESLTATEQLQLMKRLGYYLVWATLARPEGLHFKLDLRQPEQRDVARDVVKVRMQRILLAPCLPACLAACLAAWSTACLRASALYSRSIDPQTRTPRCTLPTGGRTKVARRESAHRAARAAARGAHSRGESGGRP